MAEDESSWLGVTRERERERIICISLLFGAEDFCRKGNREMKKFHSFLNGNGMEVQINADWREVEIHSFVSSTEGLDMAWIWKQLLQRNDY